MDATADQGGTSGRPTTNLARRYSARRRARALFTKRRHAAIAALAVLASPLSPIVAVEAQGVTVIAGACVFTFTLRSSSDVPLVPPEHVTWTITEESGICVDSDAAAVPYTGSINGTLASAAEESAACLGGALTGEVVLDVSPSFPSVTAHATVLMAGVSLSLVARQETVFVGAGSFANDGTEVAECPLGGWDETNWTGVFAFVDPTV